MADVTEQAARLNTLMRFHQYIEALPFAYKYRLDLQLTFPKSSQIERALEGVEEIIDRLERDESRWKRWGKIFWGKVVDEPYLPPDDLSGESKRTVPFDSDNSEGDS